MRNFILAAAAFPLALLAAPVAPASAGGCCDDDGYYHHHHHHGYAYSYYYRYEAPPAVVYKHYLPDEDDFHPKPKHHTYVPWYVGWEYSRVPLYSYRTVHSYGHYRGHGHHRGYKRSSYSDCGWLKRRAKHSDSKYWWKRYHDCRD